MRLNTLRLYNHPDISDHVVHFTGRAGSPNPDLPDDIARLKDWERLGQLLVDQRILAFPPCGLSDPVVSFTECTRAGIQQLTAEGRYSPCGVAFSKSFVFQGGGGPALYIRGDEWEYVQSLPIELRSRAARLWPGAVSDSGLSLPWYVERPSEWLHEREWRVLGCGSPPAFDFGWDDVAFVISPDPSWQGFIASFIEGFAPEYVPYFLSIPTVVVSADGQNIDDPERVWI